jgi:hypothetical protein
MQISDADQTFTFQIRRVLWITSFNCRARAYGIRLVHQERNYIYWGCIHGQIMQIYQESFC